LAQGGLAQTAPFAGLLDIEFRYIYMVLIHSTHHSTYVFITCLLSITLNAVAVSPRMRGDGQGLAQNMQLKHNLSSFAVDSGDRNTTAKRRWNISHHMLLEQLEYELHLSEHGTAVPTKNKIVLALIEVLGFGLCGVDRCFMGQPCLGTLKGLSLGGFLIWMLVDYFIVVLNCITKQTSISVLGFQATFEEGTVNKAFWGVTLVIAFQILQACMGASRKLNKQSAAAESH